MCAWVLGRQDSASGEKWFHPNLQNKWHVLLNSGAPLRGHNKAGTVLLSVILFPVPPRGSDILAAQGACLSSGTCSAWQGSVWLTGVNLFSGTCGTYSEGSQNWRRGALKFLTYSWNMTKLTAIGWWGSRKITLAAVWKDGCKERVVAKMPARRQWQWFKWKNTGLKWESGKGTQILHFGFV